MLSESGYDEVHYLLLVLKSFGRGGLPHMPAAPFLAMC
jgi:hypothetical protein